MVNIETQNVQNDKYITKKLCRFLKLYYILLLFTISLIEGHSQPVKFETKPLNFVLTII